MKGKVIPCVDPHPLVESVRGKYGAHQSAWISTTPIEIEDEVGPSLGGIQYFGRQLSSYEADKLMHLSKEEKQQMIADYYAQVNLTFFIYLLSL